MNRSLKWTLGGLAALAGLGIAGAGYLHLSPYGKYLKVFSDPVEGMQLIMADALRSKLPRRVDDTTDMIDVQAQGKMLTFVFSLRAQNTGARPNWVRGKQALLKQTCGNESFKKALEIGASYRFEFRDSSAVPLGGFTVEKSDCQA